MARLGGIGSSGASSGGSGWVRVADVEPTDGNDVVDTKVFDSSGTILQSCRATTLEVDITVFAAFPLVTIDGSDYELTLALDSSSYVGVVSVTLAAAGSFEVQSTTPDGAAGAIDTFALTLLAPPTLLTLSFTGGYPGSQTELKEGDTFQVTGTTDRATDAIFVQDSGAGSGETVTGLSGTSFTATITVPRRGVTAQDLAATIQARDAVTGALGAAVSTNAGAGGVDGTDLIKLNDLHPTVDSFTKTGAGATTSSSGRAFGIAYPGAQTALKGVETADVTAVATNYDSIVYNDLSTGELTPANATTYASPKTVTRAGGTYNVSTDNFRAVATRDANASTTTVSGNVAIANVAAVATVSFSGSRIRSGVSPGADTTITLSFDQAMIGTPTMDPAASRGTFTGAFSGGSSSFTATLRVPDADNPMNGSSNSWINLSASNRAGTATTTVTTGGSYVVGGFTSRTLNFAAFTANSTESVPVTTEGNLSVGSFSNGNPGVVQANGTADTSTVGREGWTAPNAASGSTTMRMLHTPTVAANSGGLTLATVEETA